MSLDDVLDEYFDEQRHEDRGYRRCLTCGAKCDSTFCSDECADAHEKKADDDE